MTPIQEEQLPPPTIAEMLDFLDREILPDLDNLLEMVGKAAGTREDSPMWGVWNNSYMSAEGFKDVRESLAALKGKADA